MDSTKSDYLPAGKVKEENADNYHCEPEEKVEAIEAPRGPDGSDILVAEGDIPQDTDDEDQSDDCQPDSNGFPRLHGHNTILRGDCHGQPDEDGTKGLRAASLRC